MSVAVLRWQSCDVFRTDCLFAGLFHKTSRLACACSGALVFANPVSQRNDERRSVLAVSAHFMLLSAAQRVQLPTATPTMEWQMNFTASSTLALPIADMKQRRLSCLRTTLRGVHESHKRVYI